MVCCCVLQSAVDIDGNERSLQEFAGKVTVFVNVASKCGYTDANYKGRQCFQCIEPRGLWGWGRCQQLQGVPEPFFAGINVNKVLRQAPKDSTWL